MRQITNKILSPGQFPIVLMASSVFASGDKNKKVTEKKPVAPKGGIGKKTSFDLPPIDPTASKRPEPGSTIDKSPE